MSSPLPKDPLDEPIAQFVNAVKNLLAVKAAGVDPPAQIRTGNPIQDVVRNYEEFKRHLARCHTALVGAEPEADERLRNIVLLGSDVIALTDDPHIVGPVEDLVRMASEARADIGNIITRIGNATSLPTVLALMGEVFGFGSRAATRDQNIGTTLDSLEAYYLMRMPPRDSA